MWDVFATLDYELANEYVDHSMKARFIDGDKEKNKSIEIDPEIYEMMMKSNYFTKKKGRVLSIMTTANINKRISRKRKAKVELYKPDTNPFKKLAKRSKRKELDEDDDQIVDMRPLKKDKLSEESNEHENMEVEKGIEDAKDDSDDFSNNKRDNKQKLKSILDNI